MLQTVFEVETKKLNIRSCVMKNKHPDPKQAPQARRRNNS